MLKSVMNGLILENLETLKHYQTMKGGNSNTVEGILRYVSGVITSFPWYFRFPVIILANIIGLLCLITTGQRLNFLSSEKRSSFLRHVQFIPFFNMLNKLVRSMSFLKLFDSLPMTPDCSDSINFESN
jgi:hypothetical protein